MIPLTKSATPKEIPRFSVFYADEVTPYLLEDYPENFDPLAAVVESVFCGVNGNPLAFVAREARRFLTLFTYNVAFVDVDLDSPAVGMERAIHKLARALVDDSTLGFRVYRTAAGLRYLLTSEPMAPKGEKMLRLFDRLGCDPRYTDLCRSQGFFAARLEPKRLRCATRASDYATTAFMWDVGNPAVHPEARTIIDLHDRATEAHSGKFLA